MEITNRLISKRNEFSIYNNLLTFLFFDNIKKIVVLIGENQLLKEQLGIIDDISKLFSERE